MENVGKELAKAAVAWLAALLVALFLKAQGLGKWGVAAASGAAGGLVVAASFA